MPEKLFNGPADPAMAAKAKEQLKEAQTKPYEPADLVEAGNYLDSIKSLPMRKQLEEYKRIGEMFPDTLRQAAANKFAEWADTDEFKNLPEAEQYKLFNKYMPDTLKNSPDLAKKQRDAIKGDPEAIATLKEIEEGFTENYNEANGVKEPATEESTKEETETEASKEEKEEVIADAQNAATNEDGSFDVDMFLDALFTGLQNVGGTLLNVGAAYTGGSPGFKTDRKPLWRERLEGKNKAITSSLMNAVKGSDSNMQYQQLTQALKSMGYQNASEQRRQEIANQIMKEYRSAIENGSVTNVEVENLINVLNTTDTQGQLSPIRNAIMSLL